MTRINYKSDFDFILSIKDASGTDIGWPTFDWTVMLYTTSKVNSYKAGMKNGVPFNCFNDNGLIHIVCDSHRLGSGIIHVELHAELPDNMFNDGKRNLYYPDTLGIELVDGAGSDTNMINIEASCGIPSFVNDGEEIKSRLNEP